MRHLAKLAAAGLAAGIAATACGAATNVLQGKTPTQIVQLASAQVTGQSYRLSIDGHFSIDVSGISGIPSDTLDQLAGAMKDFSMTGKGDVQNAQRLKLSMTLSLGSLGDKTFAAVLYDGHYYVALDGKSFADAGSLNLQGIAASPDDIKSELQDATSVKDLGATIRDGQHVEHLQAHLNANYMNDMLNKVTGSGSGAQSLQQAAELFKNVVTIGANTIDVYVRTSDGRVESVDTDMTMSFDMAKFVSLLTGQLGGAIPPGGGAGDVSGAMVMKITGTDRFTDYGARITVSKPTVDPNAPGLPGLFGGSSSSTGA